MLTLTASKGMMSSPPSLPVGRSHIQDMGGAEGKAAYIGTVKPSFASRAMANLVIRYRRHLSSRTNSTDCWPIWRYSSLFINHFERRSFYLVDPDTALQNVTYARCNNSEQQIELLEKLGELFVSGEFRLLIIDSVMACFRVDYFGRGELSERQQKLGQFLDLLKKIAEGFNVCVFMVLISTLSISSTLTNSQDKSSTERSWC